MATFSANFLKIIYFYPRNFGAGCTLRFEASIYLRSRQTVRLLALSLSRCVEWFILMIFCGFIAHFRAQNLIYFAKIHDFSTKILAQNLIHIDDFVFYFISLY